MVKKIFSTVLCSMLMCGLFAVSKTTTTLALHEGFTATELTSSQSITVDGTKDEAWNNAVAFDLNTVRQTHLNNADLANQNCATGKVSMMYNSSKLYLFAEITDSTKLNNVAAWDPFNVLEYDSYKYNTDYLNIQLDIKHDNPTNYDQGWGSDYNGGKQVAAHFELAAGAGELTYSADGTSGWVYDTSNELFTLSEYAKTHSRIFSLPTDTGYTFEMEIDLADAGVTDFKGGKTIGLYVGYWDRYESSGGNWGEQSLTTTAFEWNNYEPWKGPGWLPEVTFVAAPTPTNFTAKQTKASLGTADGVKDEAYNAATAIPINVVTWENENATPATGNMYLLWDSSYLYAFVEVTDDVHYAYQLGTWLEHRDALEMMVDLYHNTSYTGGYGGDYRGDKMCEGFYKIAAGIGQASVDSTIQGMHWMWDDQKNNGSYASALTETGYTVEYKIALGKDAAEYMVADRQIGLGVKLYDKHADDKNCSITVLEGKNDGQTDGPRNLSSVQLVGFTAEEILAELKTNIKYELEVYKDANLYRDAEKELLAAAISNGKTAIDNATSTEEANAALASAKATIDEIKTKAQYEAEEALSLAELKTVTKSQLESYKATDLYRDAEKALLATAINNGKAAIDAANSTAEVQAALASAKETIDGIKTKAQYEAEEAQALLNAKTTAKSQLEAYKDADLYRDAEKELLAAAINSGKTAIDNATSSEEVNTALASAKETIDGIKTKAQYEAEETQVLLNAKTNAKSELESYKDADLYRDAEKELLATAINNGKTAIDNATSSEEVNTALTNAKAAIDEIKTAAKYEEEEAAKALLDAKTAAKAELEAYKSVDYYRTAEGVMYLTAVDNGKVLIDQATSIEEVNVALTSVKKAIDSIKTKAQYEAEEAAKALEDAKTAAKAELDTYKSLEGLSEAQITQVADIIAAGKASIDAATLIENVNSTLETVKASLDEITPIPAEKKGCKGVATSTFFAMLVLAAGLLGLKKKN